MSGANFNYKFGPKNNWRRWAWNRIVERLSVPPRDAVVLYLAGGADLDRPLALDRGFRRENLIAIERDSGVCKELRGAGVLTINGDMIDIISSWNRMDVHVVFADLCCGMNKKIAFLAWLLASSRPFSSSVLAFNLLAGRDQINDDSARGIGDSSCVVVDGDGDKHRGRNVFWANITLCMQLMDSKYGFYCAKNPLLKHNLNLLCRPAFSDYMSSSNQRFDSAVWRNLSLKNVAPDIPEHLFEKFSASACEKTRREFGLKPKTSQIAAIKAHRTMRLAE